MPVLLDGHTGRVTIHSEHPFATPDSERSPLRRLRGRLPQAVTVWTTGAGAAREGWTLSSVLVADGEPGEVLGLLDPDSDLAAELDPGTALVVNVLDAGQRAVADAFARVAPSPGGPFRTGDWEQGPHGPRLLGAQGWLGVRVLDGPEVHVGWSLLVRAVVETVELDADRSTLVHTRGRYSAG
ncbi:NADH-FMN oxidoreductase RutF, flavin reductase (DIM6/NTAB) family [Auraticoccus monumenti]|uniref:NADH-FMN oxidoreductase RutF, flavin reductase (DIM6/NTAB) family n=1 Tax=Auraticoccus monumenti TaxID=675864 RepID=A0A1G7CZM9_9ACTN|nr:NADH-FMN oxidoreductase RutF, flavin reductase (DIM6/NTAB) family [Auraticoccus monumenti]